MDVLVVYFSQTISVSFHLYQESTGEVASAIFQFTSRAFAFGSRVVTLVFAGAIVCELVRQLTSDTLVER